MLLIQFKEADGGTRVGILDATGRRALPLAGARTTHALALSAIAAGTTLEARVAQLPRDGAVDYATLAGEGRLLPPLTHDDPAHCLVSGTGLTHLGSLEFCPMGAENVRVRFAESTGATVLTVHDPDVVLTARKPT